jgi:Putative phage abortive infection protein
MSKSENAKSPGYVGLVLLLTAVVALWATSGWLLHADKERGTFGDMFGAINALFSGLAFASLIYTVYLQRHELQMQREELRLTRDELQGQRLQLAAQNDVLRTQNFENTFFQLLRLLNDTVNAIDLQRSADVTNHGRDCFTFFFGNFKNWHGRTKAEIPSAESHDVIAAAYSKFYGKYQSDVGHYFRTLYNIIKFVHLSGVENKKFYTNLVRAQLSSHELLLLFYNCQTPRGREKFKPLVERYALLKTVPRELLLEADHLALYDAAAYGEG